MTLTDYYLLLGTATESGSQVTRLIALGLLSYLSGSIPFGLLIGKTVKGIDLREHGSGNIGATNAGRVLGAKWGLICLALDAMKGFLPVAYLSTLILGGEASGGPQVLSAVATIVGHMFPCWLGFRGGKGVATSLGVAAVLSPYGLLTAIVTFAATFGIWRIVSLSSMCAAIAFGSCQLVMLSPNPFKASTLGQAIFAIAVPLLIIIQHRSNLRRLIKGEEPRFTSKKEEMKPESDSTSNEPPMKA